jgi:hypothetical protein
VRWLLVLGLCAACDGRDVKPAPIKRVDRLEERDRGELIQIAGRASQIVARMARGSAGPAHIRFLLTLDHDGRTIAVVTKDPVPDMFREGVDVEVIGRCVHAQDVREGLDHEGFTDVRGGDVLLAREVRLAPLDFQF